MANNFRYSVHDRTVDNLYSLFGNGYKILWDETLQSHLLELEIEGSEHSVNRFELPKHGTVVRTNLFRVDVGPIPATKVVWMRTDLLNIGKDGDSGST